MMEMTADDFWRFSLDRYSRDGVSEMCLQLQDHAGADVNMMLLCLWVGSASRLLSREELSQLIEGEAGNWHRDIVLPLRAARKAMKGRSVAGDFAGVESFRDRIKKLEIESEKWEQHSLVAALSQFAQKPARKEGEESKADIARKNLEAYLHQIAPNTLENNRELLTRLVEVCI
ncbi:MAG: TIGR02444 family protein [Pseudomonadota bacterium]